MRRRFAIRECARLWREEQSRAIDKGDVARAAHAEKCARRFDEYLAEEQPRSTGSANSAAGGASSA
jgi:hypothetical protein